MGKGIIIKEDDVQILPVVRKECVVGLEEIATLAKEGLMSFKDKINMNFIDENITFETINITVQCSNAIEGEQVVVLVYENDTNNVINGGLCLYNGGKISFKVQKFIKYYVVVKGESENLYYYPKTDIIKSLGNGYVRDITLTITPLTSGVYIETTNHNLVSTNDYVSSMGAECIIASNGDNYVKIALDNVDSSTHTWGKASFDIVGVENLTAANAKLDFNGLGHTNTIVEELSEDTTDCAAKLCKAYKTENGNSCYLGSAGEWQIVYSNYAAVNTALAKVGGTELTSVYYSTSNEISATNYCRINPYNGTTSSVVKTTGHLVRPFVEK